MHGRADQALRRVVVGVAEPGSVIRVVTETRFEARLPRRGQRAFVSSPDRPALGAYFAEVLASTPIHRAAHARGTAAATVARAAGCAGRNLAYLEHSVFNDASDAARRGRAH